MNIFEEFTAPVYNMQPFTTALFNFNRETESETHLAYHHYSSERSSQILSTPDLMANIPFSEPLDNEFSNTASDIITESTPVNQQQESFVDSSNNEALLSDNSHACMDLQSSLDLSHRSKMPIARRIATFSNLIKAPNKFGFSVLSPSQQSIDRESPIDETLLFPLFSIFASVGQYSVVCDKTAEGLEKQEGSSGAPQSSPKFLQCVDCPTRIPLSDLSMFASLKPSTNTRETLGILSEQHNSDCASRRRARQLSLTSAELSKPIEEGSDLSAAEITEIKLASDVWEPAPKVLLEEMRLYYSYGGNLMHSHPQIYEKALHFFPPLPKQPVTKPVTPEYLSSPQPKTTREYPLLVHVRDTSLNYFEFQNRRPVPMLIYDVRRCIREVHYDRGTIVNAIDIEAKEMAYCMKRHDSFSNSDLLRGKEAAYQLSQLGFFFVGDPNSPGKLRCSFCRCTIHMFITEDAPYLEKDFDRRLIALLHCHSHLSATCPFSLGLKGDDKRFSTDDLTRVIDPLIRTRAIQISAPNLCLLPHPDINEIQESLCTLLSKFPDHLPELDGNNYFELLSESDYEMLSQFDSERDFEINSDFVDDLTPTATPVDYLLGAPPMYRNYWPFHLRVDTLYSRTNATHSTAQDNVPTLSPEARASAGFFCSPTGGVGSMWTCFWCGLTLGHWKLTDDPFNEHARIAPRCTWLFRTRGRHRVKNIYLQAQRNSSAASNIINVKAENIAFICDVHEIAGGLDQFSAVDYRMEMREIKARVDLPGNRAALDEFGYSLELLFHALSSQLVETGCDYISAQELLETLWEYEKWKLEQHVDSDSAFVARAEELHRVARNSGSNPVSGNPANSTCLECKSAQSSNILIPCGHFPVCQCCYGRLQQCPICRAVIRGSIRTYTV